MNGVTSTVTTVYYYDCSTGSYSETSTEVDVTNYCASVNIPSGYTYDSVSDFYIYETISTSEDDETGYTTITTTITYYDCNTQTYTSESSSYSYTDYCAPDNIPSGYYYDVNETIYSYATDVVSYNSNTGVYTETVTINYYDCST